VLAGEVPVRIGEVLERVQNELFDLGADLCVPVAVEGRLRVEQAMIDALEADCDTFNESLPELRSFILPGGTPAAGGLHLARTIARRAERETLAAAASVEVSTLTFVYLNRLSDLLFILARVANASVEHPEPLWKPGGTRSASPGTTAQ
jgi:cob(I)alamin adenosyltransferase